MTEQQLWPCAPEAIKLHKSLTASTNFLCQTRREQSLLDPPTASDVKDVSETQVLVLAQSTSCLQSTELFQLFQKNTFAKEVFSDGYH